MASELGKAYVQIIPSAEGISGKISGLLGGEVSSAGQSAGQNLGASMVSALKGVIAAAGIGSMVKQALSAGGDLQQSFGGLDTIYGDAAKAAKEFSTEAVKAGISANDYAEQAVSFGASLKQAYGGDTVKAVEAANTAILDMADNSAKMGTDIGAVQSAYQGFAKQNYTMLDNLKLGYGGTKTEMERLLADAEKLSGVKYDIDNLGDVYSAIHVIQEDLGLTGVAAAEASETFSGSFAAMKAAGENLLANLALGNDITPYLNDLGETVRSFVLNNLFPMLGNLLTALPDVLSGVGGMLIQGLNIASNNANEIVNQGIQIVTSLVGAIVEAAPYLLEAALSLVLALGDALINTDWISIGQGIITQINDSLDLAAAEILGTDGNIIQSIYDGITANLPRLLSTGVEMITNLANGILNAIPGLITAAGSIVGQLASFIAQNAPTILSSGADLLLNLVNGIIDNLPEIVNAAVDVIMQLVATWAENYPTIIAAGFDTLIKLIEGLVSAIPNLITAILEICAHIVENFLSYDWISLGKDIIQGIIDGIVSLGDALITAILDLCTGAFDAVKKFFGISSPSKLMADEVGRYIPEGIAEGIEEYSGVVIDAMDDLNADVLDAATVMDLTTTSNFVPNNSSETAILARMDAILTILAKYFPEIAEQQRQFAESGVSITSIDRSLGVMLS